MAETTVKNRTCQACGADVRPNALFCYHCGGSLARAADIDLGNKNGGAPLRRTDAEVENGGQPKARTRALIIKKIADDPIPNPLLTAEEPKLKSAAAMRRKLKRLQPKRFEIIWEEHENAPNVWFVLAAILLTLFAAGILYLAIYLK